MIWTKHAKSILLIWVLLSVVFPGCAVSPVPPAAPAPIAAKSGDIELATLLESMRVKEGLPALVSAIIVDGGIHSVAAVGTRQIGTSNWVTVEDRFLIGSCAKAFTATLAAVLIEEGRLSWSTTIGDTFPEMKMRPEYRTITIKQLLSHRAGLPKNLKEGKASWLIDYGFDKDRGARADVERLQYVEQTVQRKLINPPGEVVHYSNGGYIVAAAMMEMITRVPFEELREEKLLAPLGITTVGYGLPSDLDPIGHPQAHCWDLEKQTFFEYRTQYPDFMAPTGYLYLSIRDWAKFVQMHLTSGSTEGQLLRPSSLRELHTPPDSAEWEINIDYGMNYALGWFTKTTAEGHQLLWHGGRGFCFNAQFLADLESRNAVLLVTNSEVPHIHPQLHLSKMLNGIIKLTVNSAELPLLK